MYDSTVHIGTVEGGGGRYPVKYMSRSPCSALAMTLAFLRNVLTQNMSEFANLAISLASVDNVVISLCLRTSEPKAFFLGLSANAKYLAIWSLRLRHPVLAPVVDDVLYCAHFEY